MCNDRARLSPDVLCTFHFQAREESYVVHVLALQSNNSDHLIIALFLMIASFVWIDGDVGLRNILGQEQWGSHAAEYLCVGLTVNIIANFVLTLMWGWRLWGADTGQPDTDWHQPSLAQPAQHHNWRSKIQENLNSTHSKWLKFCWKVKSYFPSPPLTDTERKRYHVAVFFALRTAMRNVQFREMVMTFTFVLWQKEVLTVWTVFRLSVGINGI